MSKIKKIIIIIVGTVLWIFAVWAMYAFFRSLSDALPGPNPQHYLMLNGKTISLEIADTPALQEQGLSDRATLAQDHGMLFVFPTSGYEHFWMKDMHFPLDIIYLDSNDRVVTIFADVAPDTYPKTIAPAAPAKYVLEVNAGFAKQNSMRDQEQLDIK